MTAAQSVGQNAEVSANYAKPKHQCHAVNRRIARGADHLHGCVAFEAGTISNQGPIAA